MTKITVDKETIERALEAIELNWKSDEGDAVKPLLRAALAEPAAGRVVCTNKQAMEVRNSIGLMKNEDERNNYGNHATAIQVLEAYLALDKQAVEPSHKLIYPGGGKSLSDKLWHLTCNAVATQSGMRVRTDVLPMIEMREFLHYLCALVDSPPSAPPAEVPLLTDDALRDQFAQCLAGVYVCGRVWSAWGYGAMSENDFSPASECEEVLDSLAQAVRQNAGLK